MAQAFGMTLGAATLAIGTIGMTAFVLHLAAKRDEQPRWPPADANHQSEDGPNL